MFFPFPLGEKGLWCGLTNKAFRLALDSLGQRNGEEAERSPEGMMVWTFEGVNWGLGEGWGAEGL